MSRLSDRLLARFGREQFNEHVKLVVNALNGVSLASVVGGLIAPVVNGRGDLAMSVWLVTFGLTLHMAAHAFLLYYRSKE